MTFKNLQFTDHPIGGGIMAQATLNNGKRLSVIAGAGFYSTPNSPISDVKEAVSFEVMVGDSEPLGWKSREEITNIIKENS